MVGVQRVMAVSVPAPTVLGYLVDHGHSAIWNPAVHSCARSDDGGPIGVGSTWDTVTEWGGRRTELTHTLTDASPTRLVFVGENATATATVEIDVEAAGPDGCTVTYHTHVRLKGLLKLAGPFLRRDFERHGDEVERALPPVLERLRT